MNGAIKVVFATGSSAGQTTLRGRRGTLVLRVAGTLLGDGEARHVFTWTISRGTGAYARWRGRGDGKDQLVAESSGVDPGATNTVGTLAGRLDGTLSRR